MTDIDTVLAMQIHLARHCSKENWLLPDNPIFPQLFSDLMLYMAHNSAESLGLCALRSIWALISIIETVPQVAYAASLAFLYFLHFLRPSSVEGSWAPPLPVRASNMQLRDTGISRLTSKVFASYTSRTTSIKDTDHYQRDSTNCGSHQQSH